MEKKIKYKNLYIRNSKLFYEKLYNIYISLNMKKKI